MYNYGVSSTFGQAFDMMIRQAVVVVLVIYTVGSIKWLFHKKDKDVIPIVVLLGTLLGACFGYAAISGLALIISRLFSQLSMEAIWIWLLLYLAFVLLFCVLGFKLSCKLKVRKPQTFLGRSGIFLVGALFIAAPVLLTVPRNDFPGEKSSLSIRHAWAQKKFSQFYDAAITYLKECQEVKESLGEIQTFGPVKGVNQVTGEPGGVYATFTLEVVGSKARAIASLKCAFFGEGKKTCSGKLFMKDSTLSLPRTPSEGRG